MYNHRKPPSIRQLQYFVAVADASNFRRASEILQVSQPALTAQITVLESTLGISLFERSRSGTLLSAQGRELLPEARQILMTVQGFMDQASVISTGHKVTYRLGVPPTLGPYLLPNVLPALHSRYHDLKLYVREAPAVALQRKLIQGEYDLAIIPLPISGDGLAVEPLFSEPLKFVVPADHPLAAQIQISPDHLRGEKVLTLEGQHHFHYEIQELCQRLGAHVHRDYEGTSLDTLRQMVVMGLGVAFLPGLYVHSEMHNPEALHVSELSGQPISRQHALIWRVASPSRVFFREFAACLRTIIRERLGDVVSIID